MPSAACASPPPATTAPLAEPTETATVRSPPQAAVTASATTKPHAGPRVAHVVPPDDPALARYVGEYPSALMSDRRLAYEARIDALLGKDKRLYADRSGVETPIYVEETSRARYLVFRTCMPHNCSVEEALVLVNLASGGIHVAVLQDSNKVRTWSERGEPPPGGQTWDDFVELAR